MKKFFNILLILFFFVSAVACSTGNNGPTPVETKKDAVLVYFASDNNLLSYAHTNIKSLENKYSESGAKQILVYYDNGTEGTLLRIGNYERKGDAKHIVIKTYPDAPDSCDPAFLDRVLKDANDYCGQYKVTDLILWSHGKSWMPRLISSAGPQGEELIIQPVSADDNGIAQYSFGVDDSAGKAEMEIDELAKVLNKYKFSTLFFDACYMGSIEVAYQLRNAADYIVASPAEILASGYPYDYVTNLLLQDNIDGVAVAKEFFKYYNSQSGARRSATISVVDCAKLEPFAAKVKTLVDKYSTSIDNGSVRKKVPYFDRNIKEYKLLYDLKKYFSEIITLYGSDAETELADFERAFDELVIYEAHTEMMINELPLSRTNGVSLYIPYKNTAYGEVIHENEYYLTLDWSSDSGMASML